MTTKLCTKCNEDLPINLFEITKQGEKEYYRNKCKICRLKDIYEQRRKRKELSKLEITYKVCNTCSINLEVSKFNKKSLSRDGYDKICRECYKVKRHKEKQIIIPSDNNLYCIKCKITKSYSEFRTNACSSTGYFKTCNSCWKPREWNKEKQRISEKKYVKNNPDKIREKYKRVRYIIHSRLNRRIKIALLSTNAAKNNNTMQYIGCDISYLKKWFEFQFTDNMNWNNINEWHIDHVVPCKEFDLTNEEQQKECFNWQNLRPCMAQENLTKSSKIISSLINSHKKIVSKFLEINPLPTHPGNRGGGTE